MSRLFKFLGWFYAKHRIEYCPQSSHTTLLILMIMWQIMKKVLQRPLQANFSQNSNLAPSRGHKFPHLVQTHSIRSQYFGSQDLIKTEVMTWSQVVVKTPSKILICVSKPPNFPFLMYKLSSIYIIWIKRNLVQLGLG